MSMVWISIRKEKHTMLVIVIGWFFRADDAESAFCIFKSIICV